MLSTDPFGTVCPIGWPEFREYILMIYKPPLRSRGCFLAVQQAMVLFEAAAAPTTTADLTVQNIAKFVASRSGIGSPNTLKHHLRKLSAISTLAVASSWLRISPFAIRSRWVRGVTPRSPRVPSLEEIGRVLARARQEIQDAPPAWVWRCRRLYALVAVVAYTGLRRTEALTLKVVDVHLADGYLDVTARPDFTLKTPGAAAPVPIPEALKPILAGWLPNVGASEWVFPCVSLVNPWHTGSVAGRPVGRLRALGERAGVPSLTFLGLRHAWATHAEFWGLSELQVQRVLRHTTTSTQKTYRHAQIENMRAMVANVRFEDPPAAAAPEPPAAAAVPELPALVPAPGPSPPVVDAMFGAPCRLPSPDSWVVRKALARFAASLRERGRTLQEVATTLNAGGHRTARGSRWSVASVGRLIDHVDLPD